MKRAFPLTENINILEYYLRNGNTNERIEAICQFDNTRENYGLFWEIFLSDINKKVRHNALSACIYSKKDKIWKILDYLITTNERKFANSRVSFESINDDFIIQVAKYLNDNHKKNLT